jgi:hypothetical protein
MNYGPSSKKTATDESEREAERGQGEAWIWRVIETSSRWLVNYRAGTRFLGDALAKAQELKSTRSGKLPLFVGDEPPRYKTVLEEVFSRYGPVPRAGKKGRPANPIRAIDPDLLRSSVKKTRKRGRGSKLSVK